MNVTQLIYSSTMCTCDAMVLYLNSSILCYLYNLLLHYIYLVSLVTSYFVDYIGS